MAGRGASGRGDGAERVLGVLRDTVPFSALDEGRLERLAPLCRVLALDPQEVLLRDGQVLSYAYILTRGCLTRSFVTAEGKAVILNHTRPVTAFCCSSAIDGSAHIGAVVAQEPSEVVAVPVTSVTCALEESPAFSLAMAHALARSSVRQTEAIRELMFPVPVRLARLLCRRADEAGSPEVDLDMSRAALAEVLATVPETLSRALATLRRKGFVEAAGRTVRIVDLPALRGYAQM